MKSSINPRVSIVIPVYNGADYMAEAIDSALAQTYRNIEVIVVNDGSADKGKTEAIARSYGERIRYFRKENGGVSTALNLGIREMTGEYFSWLSHDDVFHPDKTAVQVDFLDKLGRKEVILYSDYESINEKGETLGRRKITVSHPERMRLYLIVANHPVNGCTTLIPRCCFDRCGLFDESLRSTQDYDMWFRLAKDFPFVHVPQPLLKSRIHPRQGCNATESFHRDCDAMRIDFLSRLGEDEIGRLTDDPLSVFYAKAAIRLKILTLDEASRFALALSRQRGRGDGAVAAAYRLGLDLFCRFLNRRMSPMYWYREVRGHLDRRRG